MRRRIAGLTLIELLIVLVILGVLASISGPAFEVIRQNSRLRVLSNGFVSDLFLTRNEAIKRNTTMTLCKSADGLACTTGGAWEDGWLVLDPNDTPIQSEAGAYNGYHILSTPDVDTISFNSQGFTTGLTLIRACVASPRAGVSDRTITLLPSGSTRVENTAPGTCP